VTRFLEFARPLRLQLNPVAPADLLDRAIAQYQRGNPRRPVDVSRNYSPDVRPVPMDAELMERVFANLLANAADASPDGALVTVKTRQADGGVEVSFIDRGSGIAPAHRESIFNPFFTTKANGVGLGLAIVTKIVDEHGGKVLVDSTPGEGSVFRVWLPAGS
jgi:signal transduction histidine kinase